MNSPLISVIIPVYKTEPYLRRCLDSVLSQDYDNLEIICINDGSPDNSAEILAEYAGKDKRVVLIEQANQGQAGAREAGFQVAHGEWISMVDSDDYLEPGIYRKAVAVISEDIDVICFNSRVVAEGGTPPKGIAEYLKLKDEGKKPVTGDLIREYNVLLWNKLWRRSIITDHRIGLVRNHIHEDYVFCFSYMVMARNIYELKEIGYNYVIRPASLTGGYETGSVEDILFYCESWDHILNFYAARGILPARAAFVAGMLKGIQEWGTVAGGKEQVTPAIRRLLAKHHIPEICIPELNKQSFWLKLRYKLSFGKRKRKLKAEYKADKTLKWLLNEQKAIRSNS